MDSKKKVIAFQSLLPSPIASSVGPSLAFFNGLLYAAWKGSGGDETIWYSAFDGNGWGLDSGMIQEPLPSPIASSVGPSLTVFNGRLYAAWKGSGSDTRMWWTSATV